MLHLGQLARWTANPNSWTGVKEAHLCRLKVPAGHCADLLLLPPLLLLLCSAAVAEEKVMQAEPLVFWKEVVERQITR
jgi:hypothetical protein